MIFCLATWLALPSLLCLSALAVPPPAYDQNLLQLTHTAQPSPSRWSSFSHRLVESLFGHARPQKDSFLSSKEQPVPAHALARYGGDLVLRFNVTSNEEAASLAEAADTLLLDVWEYSRDWVDIRLSKETVPLLLGLLPASLQNAHAPLLREKALAQAILDSYQRHQPQSAVDLSPSRLARPAFSPAADASPSGAETNIFFADYQPFSVIEPWMRLLATLFTTHVRLINIGFSYQGRNIPALRVGVHPTNNEDPEQSKRKTILVVGGLHAREWISTTTVNYVAYSLITGYGKLRGITHLLENFDFVFVPVLNPDGYVYTWETDRLWRKNRQQTGIRFCQGIDLDRSWGFEWSATDNPCSESFAGESPFEAVEAKAFADWAKNETDNNNVDFVGFLDLHSYSQEILYPYSYSCSATPPGLENLEEIAYGLGKAIRVTHGHQYEIMPACEGNVAYTGTNQEKKTHLAPRMELSGGSALDYFYHTIGVRYAYQIKLRDRGTYGFLLPKENILPTGKEILNAVLYLGSYLGELYDEDDTEVTLTKPDMDADADADTKINSITTKSSNEEAALKQDDGTLEMDDGEDDPWVVIEDVDLPEYNWDLRRRRRR